MSIFGSIKTISEVLNTPTNDSVSGLGNTVNALDLFKSDDFSKAMRNIGETINGSASKILEGFSIEGLDTLSGKPSISSPVNQDATSIETR